MACKAIVCGRGVGEGNCSLLRGNPDLRNAPSRSCFVIPDNQRRRVRYPSVGKLSVSAAKQERQIRKEEKWRKDDAVSSGEKVDEWMRESVVDIVKNLTGAPLLVHVYGEDNGTVKTRTEKAEEWGLVKRKWEKGEDQLPEGVIFVEQLEDERRIRKKELLINNGDRDNDDLDSGNCRCNEEEEEEGTRAWGLVVQGRGMDCGPVCYLLKTSRVGSESGSGVGMWCTHFCLVRVSSFRETTESQLKNCWLSQLQLQGGHSE